MLAFLLRRLRARAGRFSRDERGAVLIYVSLMLPIFIGLSLLAVDGARVYNLGTELQKAADALALAGAAELDRRPDALTRADRAIRNLVENEQRFASGGARIAIGDVRIRYLKQLPANDATRIEDEDVADGASEAIRAGKTRYVEIKINNTGAISRTLTAVLPAGFVGGQNTISPYVTAVAGFTSVVCRTTPMFICNPFEGTSTSIFDPAAKGKQIKMQLGNGGDSQYFPGNYGWLDTPTLGNGANALRDALALVSPPACYESDGVILQTGNIESANDAINVRFDLWNGPYNGDRGNSAYPPDINVRKGYAPAASGGGNTGGGNTGGGNNGGGNNGGGSNNGGGNSGGGGGPPACSPTTSAATAEFGFGRDQASFTGSTSGRLGNGAWDFESYWTNNYGRPPLNLARPNGWSNSNLPSRYAVYNHEVSTIGLTPNLVNHQSTINERGSPTCSSTTPMADRRLLYAAIINCSELDIRGNNGGEPVPVLAFGKFFMTEPIANSPNPDAGTIFSEFVDVIRPGSVGNQVARDKVQLYR